MFDQSCKTVDHGSYKAQSFFCMGGLCEVLVETSNDKISTQVFNLVYEEAKRIEKKFSRYENGNIIHKINNANGKKVSLDKETAKLVHYADQVYSVSGGFFDITSGVLRKIWTFDQSENVPTPEEVEEVRRHVGWDKVKLERKALTLPKNFEVDFGGIGKEYAVDRCISLVRELFKNIPTLVNFGGDITVTSPKKDKTPWVVKVASSQKEIRLFTGAVATSGDENKYLMHEGKKLSHILNPKTGWPITNTPSAISVIADTCTAAGTLSTLAMLKAPDHEAFLKDEAEEYFILP